MYHLAYNATVLRSNVCSADHWSVVKYSGIMNQSILQPQKHTRPRTPKPPRSRVLTYPTVHDQHTTNEINKTRLT